MEPIIDVQNLRMGYGDTILLNDVSFSIQRGERFIILGTSGCGKSSLLKHLIGLYKPMGGRILIDGVDLAKADGEERNAVLRKFGVLYQSSALFGSMTLSENVALPLETFTHHSPSEIREIALEKLSLVGLGEFAGNLPSEISGGMQKRAGIARAIALNPPLVFLDEPSAGLDPITSADLDALILELNEQLSITFVIVSHELPSIYAVGQRVIMLSKDIQGILAEGSPQKLRDESAESFVRRFFHREASAAA